MGRKPFKTADEKLAVVLSVLKGETTQVEVARRLQMSQTTIAKWQKQFLEGGRESLARGDNARGPTSRREGELEGDDIEAGDHLGETQDIAQVALRGVGGRGLPLVEDLAEAADVPGADHDVAVEAPGRDTGLVEGGAEHGEVGSHWHGWTARKRVHAPRIPPQLANPGRLGAGSPSGLYPAQLRVDRT